MYDYCLTTLGVRMPFSDFQVRVLNSLRICPTQFHPNGWAFARTFELDKHSWITLKNACQRKIFTLYTNTYKHRGVNFRNEFWKAINRLGMPIFWRNPATDNPLFNRWWTREHFFQSSNRYYVLYKQLNLKKKRIFDALDEATRGHPCLCRDLLDAADDDVVALLDSLAEMNIMAELRRAKLERLRSNQATPPPSPIPRMEVGRSDQAAMVVPKAKEEVAKGITIGGSSKGGSSKDPKVASDPKMNLDTEMISDPKGRSIPKTTLGTKEDFQEAIPDTEPIPDAKPATDPDNKGKKRKELVFF
ncbi:hypothetical protein SESBI_32320 [Sesbania bispinosa]|nr:hypothetical protein SESBI_32320 [Sesbania bispinosa]